jgi:hypothetical protein
MFPLLFFKSGNIGRRYMEDKWAEMLKKLESLRKNEDAVPMELLRTKYRKNYYRLRHDIAQLFGQAVTDAVFHRCRVHSRDSLQVSDLVSRIRKVLEAGLLKESCRVLLNEKDPEKAFCLAVDAIDRDIILGPYADYWAAHCFQVEGTWYSDIRRELVWFEDIGCWYSRETGSWEVDELPPTKELIKQKREKLYG